MSELETKAVLCFLLQRNIQLPRDSNSAVGDLEIPVSHQIFDRSGFEMATFINHLNARSMGKALKRFIPLNSTDFLGVCKAPVPSLGTLSYDIIPNEC